MRKLLSGERIAASFAIVTALCVVVLGVMGWQISQNRKLASDGKQAHDAICALKGDLSTRIDQGRDFLKAHPKGFAGITAVTIKQSVDNQQRTLDALHVVRCSADERKG